MPEKKPGEKEAATPATEEETAAEIKTLRAETEGLKTERAGLQSHIQDLAECKTIPKGIQMMMDAAGIDTIAELKVRLEEKPDETGSEDPALVLADVVDNYGQIPDVEKFQKYMDQERTRAVQEASTHADARFGEVDAAAEDRAYDGGVKDVCDTYEGLDEKVEGEKIHDMIAALALEGQKGAHASTARVQEATAQLKGIFDKAGVKKKAEAAAAGAEGEEPPEIPAEGPAGAGQPEKVDLKVMDEEQRETVMGERALAHLQKLVAGKLRPGGF